MDAFLLNSVPLFDVRAPLEYEKGHIPGAISLPLFSNEERAIVGTCYKREGQRQAIELGVKLVGPKLFSLLEIVKQHVEPHGALKLYCWRGGMRSGFVGWFLNFVGFKAEILKGGYKSYRRFALQQFAKPYQFQVLGGLTGSGKTELLGKMAQKIDLEALAHHKGSSFGQLPETFCPTQEQFENELAFQLFLLDEKRPVFIEDESRKVGLCTLPEALFERMRESPLLYVDVSREERIQRIVKEYGSNPVEYLIECTNKLMKRLGRERCQEIVQSIHEGNLSAAVERLLVYYDKSYSHSLETKHRGPITKMSTDAIISQFSSV